MASQRNIHPVIDKKEHFKTIGIVGAGMMGAGLAFICAKHGYDVIISDIDDSILAKALNRCCQQTAKLQEAHVLSDSAAKELLQKIKITTDNQLFCKCDLVIEAVNENLSLKRSIISELEAKLSQTAIFASNTSALPINDLTKSSIRPENFIGLHFFSPVEKMKLVEIVVGSKTSDKVLSKCLKLALSLEKTPIIVNDGYGFYTSRVFFSYILEGAQLVFEGYEPTLIDLAGKEAGMVIGPLRVMDEISLQLVVHAEAEREKYFAANTLPGFVLIKKMVDEYGRLGRVSGGGFYDYSNKEKNIWPGLSKLISQKPNSTSMQYLVDRLMLAQCAQVVGAIDDGILRNYQDAEIGAVLGIGFSQKMGGPLSYMQKIGLKKIVSKMNELANNCGKRYLPGKILQQKAIENTLFI